jgi:hypothetical protein
MTIEMIDQASEYDRQLEYAVEQIAIPHDGLFTQAFMSDEKLELLAEILMEHCDELKIASNFKITYLWKRKGGKSNETITLGKCIKLAGLVEYFGKADFVIWLSADHCYRIHTEYLSKRRQQDINLAALMYHELRHVSKDENDQRATRGHEFEGFASEIERFGIWRDGMRPIAKAFQESLFPEEEAAQ